MANGKNNKRNNVARPVNYSSTNYRMQALKAQRNAKIREINSQVRDIKTQIERLQSEIIGKQRKIQALASHISVLEGSKQQM